MRMRAILLFGLAGLLCGLPTLGQQTNADSPAESSKAGVQSETQNSRDRRPPLPAYFGQLGVSDKQRLDLQNVQIAYEARLDKLREELKLLVKERDQKLESLLTEGQKLRLQELREAARERSRQRAKSRQK